MTVTEPELRQRLNAAGAMPNSVAKFRELDAVIRHADAAGLDRFAVQARMTALQMYQYGGEELRAVTVFGEIVAAYDRTPELVGQDENWLLWRFKWIAADLADFPQVPLARAGAVLDDMESRYRRAGYSLRSVYQERWRLAVSAGDLDAADDYCARMVNAPADAMSDCRTCFPHKEMLHHVRRERWAEAVAVGEPASQGSCAEQPHWILADLMMPYLHIGSVDKAVEAHRRSYRRMVTERKYVGGVGRHLEFLARSGNAARGLEMLQRHLDWMPLAPSPADALRFAAGALQVLRELVAQSHEDQPVRRGGRTITVARLRDELHDEAEELAGRFDARNGNSYQSNWLRAALDAPVLTERIPLTVIEGAAPLPGRGARSAGKPTSAPRSDLGPLIGAVTEAVAAGDRAAAGTARLALATGLLDGEHLDDAAEIIEEAVLDFEAAGDDRGLAGCRYRLFDLYRRDYRRRTEARALGEALLAADPYPLAEPPRWAVVAEVANVIVGAARRTGLLHEALAGARADGADEAELRLLRQLCDHGDPLTKTYVERADELIGRITGASDDYLRWLLDNYPAWSVRTLLRAGCTADAIDRAERHWPAATGGEDEALPGTIMLAETYAAAGRAAEAIKMVEGVYDRLDENTRWHAATIMVTALTRTEDRAAADAWLTAHDFDPEDFDPGDFDPEEEDEESE